MAERRRARAGRRRGPVLPLALAAVLAARAVGAEEPASTEATTAEPAAATKADEPASTAPTPADVPATATKEPAALSGPAAVSAIPAEPFVCPEGTKDSGLKEHQPARWCGYEQDGRTVFHGPVWRFHRNGQLLAKERFVDGVREGEVWFFWDDGRPSSHGQVEKGERVGIWQSWDQQGHLTVEEGYSAAGIERDEYYPSGKKRSEGLVRAFDGAKVGWWELFYEDGGNSRCDFGEGLFALPPGDEDCRKIAEQVEPKGFGRPLAKGSVTEDGFAIVTIGPQSYAFRAPPGWVADASAGAAQGIPLVFVPEGSTWKDPHRNMWIRVVLTEGRQLDVITYDTRREFAARVGDYREFLLAPRKGRLGRIDAERLRYPIPTRPDAPFAMVDGRDVLGAAAFMDVSPEVVLLVVFEADSKVPMKRSRDAFIALIESVRPPRPPPPR